LDSSELDPQPKSTVWKGDFFALQITLFFWLFWGTIFAFLSMRDLSPGNAAIAWLSILSGPLAFFDPPTFSPVEKILLALGCIAAVALHAFARQPGTSFLACLAISFWFMMGLGLTFIGV
jgi:hypothetical protein